MISPLVPALGGLPSSSMEKTKQENKMPSLLTVAVAT